MFSDIAPLKAELAELQQTVSKLSKKNLTGNTNNNPKGLITSENDPLTVKLGSPKSKLYDYNTSVST